MAITEFEQRTALAPVLRIERDAHEPLLREQLRDIPRELRIVRTLESAILQIGFRETADRVRECLLLFVQFEIHLPGAPAGMCALFPNPGFDLQLNIGYRSIT